MLAVEDSNAVLKEEVLVMKDSNAVLKESSAALKEEVVALKANFEALRKSVEIILGEMDGGGDVVKAAASGGRRILERQTS